MAVELAEHQLKAIEQCRNGYIFRGGVGTGKSRTAIGYYFLKVCQGGVKINGQGDWSPMKTPRDLYIITTAKKRDKLEWEAECAPFGIGQNRVTSFGNVQVTVDSWNNITKYQEVKDAFFIFDEQRLVGSGKWVKAFLAMAKNNSWVLLSATPGDVWSDYIPIFIAHGHYKNRTEFLTRHAVYSRYSKYPKVVRYLEEGHLHALRRAITIPMYYDRKTTRHERIVEVEHDRTALYRLLKERWHIYEERPLRDITEMLMVMRKLVNSDESRLAAVAELVRTIPRTIIFYNFNYELEALRALMGEIGVPFAEWNGHKHEEIPEGERWVYLVQYTAGAEGWNCTSTDTIIFYSLNYSYRLFEQSKGRIDRLNTPYTDLYYYILKSSSMIDDMIWESLSRKEDFNVKSHSMKF